MANASMKSFEPKDDGAPPDDDGGPDNPPAVKADTIPDQPEKETTPMARPARDNRNAEVDLRGESQCPRIWWNFIAAGGVTLGCHRGVGSRWSLATSTADLRETRMTKIEPWERHWSE
jgi:hypothetical protein